MRKEAFTCFFSAIIAFVVLVSGAQAATVGNEAISRSVGDGFNDFAIVTGGPIAEAGILTAWETHIRFTEGDNRVGLLLLSSTDASSDFVIEAIDIRNVDLGFNSFTTSIAVEAGWFIGAFMADAKISFDGAGVFPTFATLDEVFISADPAIGNTVDRRSTGNRTYSLSATIAPVPLPAAFPMLAAALGGILLLRRRGNLRA